MRQTVRIWKASTRDTLFVYRHHNKRVMSVGWSPSNSHVRSSSWDRTVREWDFFNDERYSWYTFPFFRRKYLCL